MALRVLICDERPLVTAGLQRLLSAEPDFDIVGVADSGVHALMLVRSERPHAVVTGLRLRGMSGTDLTRRLRGDNEQTNPPVVVYAVEGSEETHTEVLRAGANALLSDDASREELVLAIRAVTRGQAMLGPSVARRLLDWFRKHETEQPRPLDPLAMTLTTREREILLLTAQGLSVEQIASKLYIGVATVRTHIYRLRCKLQVRDRAQLVSFAYQAGLVNFN
ncbi:response regulator transcription factor [Micromonospora sp. C28ISP2-4]|uniref:response regulator n=1 Tax=Micromonospora sp. C28ISP2-4 TaxID=3059523 RepID=UPI0026752D26|nr:response regulator transcription factor [Micromonospora sp. C28ISP2-4]MDO3685975.1 response regulator transcription factor [Micromonospora sp. C28ISP2-4]